MATPVIEVHHISKSFNIGALQVREDRSLLGNALQIVMEPLRRTRAVLRGELPQFYSETFWALQDVSFQINQGEIVGIIGHNGSGKSTLLKILSRITPPTKGYAKLRGNVAALLEVGTGFNVELTGRENIYLNGSILGMSKQEIDRKLDEIIDFAGIDAYIDTPVKRYSSGMGVRLGFAVAAHLEPEILLVDEVLAVGDVAFQKKCLGKMDDVAQSGRTVIFVSHSMETILGLCPRTIWLDHGCVRRDGDTESVVLEYVEASMPTENQAFPPPETRQGEGQIRFTSFHIQDLNGVQISKIMAGQDIEFVCNYTGSEALNGNISAVIWLKDSRGQKLMRFGTRLVNQDFSYLPPQGQLVCRVEHFPIAPGNYHISLGIYMNAVEQDWIPTAHVFDVIFGDFFGTGQPLYKSGLFLHPSNWQVKPQI